MTAHTRQRSVVPRARPEGFTCGAESTGMVAGTVAILTATPETVGRLIRASYPLAEVVQGSTMTEPVS
ncbi:hypothetical protein JXA88_08055 [Candidatus Fermentibacteria bacterium]|nr:hypothetical protein [Candidatus Fermentibacteria bacterium]